MLASNITIIHKEEQWMDNENVAKQEGQSWGEKYIQVRVTGWLLKLCLFTVTDSSCSILVYIWYPLKGVKGSCKDSQRITTLSLKCTPVMSRDNRLGSCRQWQLFLILQKRHLRSAPMSLYYTRHVQEHAPYANMMSSKRNLICFQVFVWQDGSNVQLVNSVWGHDLIALGKRMEY